MSLSTEGFTLLGTLKVPSLGVGVTSSNTPLLIKAADLTTAMKTSLKNDWGDLRLSTDSAGNTQLPLEIVANDIAWTRLTSVAADELIHVWGNKPAAIKETDTAAFGRNAVWVDYYRVYHLYNDGVDSTGRGDINTVGATFINAPNGQRAIDLAGQTYSENSGAGGNTSQPISLSFYELSDLNEDGAAVGISNDSTGNDFSVFGKSSQKAYAVTRAGPTNTIAQVTSPNTLPVDWNYLQFRKSSSTLDVNDGVSTEVDTDPENWPDNAILIQLGATKTDSSFRYTGNVSTVKISLNFLSDDYWSIERQNATASGAWWIAEDAGGGGGGGTAHPLTLEQSQQLNQSELISILSAQAFTLGLSEQVNQSSVSGLTLDAALSAIQAEQLNQSNTLSIQQVAGQGLTLEATEQLNQSNALSASQVAAISAEITEQINQSELIGIVSASAVILEATEQVNQSSTLEINQSDGQLLALTVVEQANQSTTLLVSQVGGLTLDDSEQVNDSTSISLTQLAAINGLAVEQINQTNLLNIIQTGDLTDLKGIKFEPVSKVFALTEINNTTYTLEEI